MTLPLKDLITEKLPDNSEDVVNWFVKCLNEARNFGSHIFDWDLKSNTHKDDSLPILMLLRCQIDILDSLSILAEKGSGDTAKILGRALLENSLYIEYLLENDQESRAYAFLTEDILTQINLAKRADSTSSQGKELLSLFKKELGSEIADNPNKDNIEDFINSKYELLQSDKFSACYLESQRLRQNKIKPKWYSYYNGPKTIAELAKKLEKQLFYELMYRKWSRTVHGTDVYSGKIRESEDKFMQIVQIRYIKDLQEVVTNVLLLTCSVYRKYVTQRVPNKDQNYKHWYSEFRIDLQKLVDKRYLIIE